jgi:hypothetical protein
VETKRVSASCQVLQYQPDAVQNDVEGEEPGILSESGDASDDSDSDCGETDEPEQFSGRVCSLQLNSLPQGGIQISNSRLWKQMQCIWFPQLHTP